MQKSDSKFFVLSILTIANLTTPLQAQAPCDIILARGAFDSSVTIDKSREAETFVNYLYDSNIITSDRSQSQDVRIDTGGQAFENMFSGFFGVDGETKDTVSQRLENLVERYNAGSGAAVHDLQKYVKTASPVISSAWESCMMQYLQDGRPVISAQRGENPNTITITVSYRGLTPQSPAAQISASGTSGLTCTPSGTQTITPGSSEVFICERSSDQLAANVVIDGNMPLSGLTNIPFPAIEDVDPIPPQCRIPAPGGTEVFCTESGMRAIFFREYRYKRDQVAEVCESVSAYPIKLVDIGRLFEEKIDLCRHFWTADSMPDPTKPPGTVNPVRALISQERRRGCGDMVGVWTDPTPRDREAGVMCVQLFE